MGLNAILAVAPNNPVMIESINNIRKWYTNEIEHLDYVDWMGPWTLILALRTIVDKECKGSSTKPEVSGLEWSCGPEVFRFYQEKIIQCSGDPTPECPPSRRGTPFG